MRGMKDLSFPPSPLPFLPPSLSPSLLTGQATALPRGAMSEHAAREGQPDGARVLPVPAPHVDLRRQGPPTQSPAHQQSDGRAAGQGNAESARHRPQLPDYSGTGKVSDIFSPFWLFRSSASSFDGSLGQKAA